MHNGLRYFLKKHSYFQGQSGSNLFLSSQTEQLMAGTKFSDYLGLKQYNKAKK